LIAKGNTRLKKMFPLSVGRLPPTNPLPTTHSSPSPASATANVAASLTRGQRNLAGIPKPNSIFSPVRAHSDSNLAVHRLAACAVGNGSRSKQPAPGEGAGECAGLAGLGRGDPWGGSGRRRGDLSRYDLGNSPGTGGADPAEACLDERPHREMQCSRLFSDVSEGC
jgi:hypothetical protein